MIKSADMFMEFVSNAGEQFLARLSAIDDQSWRDFSIVVAAAFFIRLIAMASAAHFPLWGDERTYWRLARAALAGPYNNSFFPPLWSYLLMIPRSLDYSPLAGRFLGVCLGTATSSFIYATGRNVFDRRTALLCGLIYALSPEEAMFASYLWAETFMAFIIAAATWMFFRNSLLVYRPKQIAAVSFFLGIGFLCKHFALYPLVAFLGMVFFQKRPFFLKALLAASLFLVPPVLYSAYLGATDRDPGMLLNVVIKNAREFDNHGPRGYFDPNNRSAVIFDYVSQLESRGWDRYYHSFKRFSFKLWGPHSFVSARAVSAGYYFQAGSAGLANLVMWFYVFVIVFGLCGLCLSFPSSFKLYTIFCVALFSLTAFVVVVQHRHRIPCLFFFDIFAGVFLAHPSRALDRLYDWKNAIPLFMLLATFTVVVLSQLYGIKI